MKNKFSFIFLQSLFVFQLLSAQPFISEKKQAGYFPIITDSYSVSIYTDSHDYALIQKSAALLQTDIENVTGKNISIIHETPLSKKNIIIIGTKARSSLIQQLIQKKIVNANKVSNKWEAYQLQSIAQPFKNIGHAFVIMGNDRRGAAFGVSEFSKQIGVSPWYWWADVPIKKKKEIYVKENFLFSDSPKVKYRGIFLNDEAPALSGWSKEKFGGFNHLFYEKVFELILRLKGNYLWPAMWGSAFYDDDSLNKKSADDFGIVIGTSHHEPLMRAHDEWRRYGRGPWDYDINAAVLQRFWEDGMKRIGNTETIVSIGMRGDGDKPMTEGTAISLLERIVKDQRKIIEEVTHKPAYTTPQLWALYKEVQDYYEKGMRVPDDVTLLLCDDNWGNIRMLPKLTDKPRGGGYGIYYHFDYVGDPRNYKWLNTNQLERTWEQMHLAYEYGVNRIWIVNVGDLKPMEFPISFFLDYAWNPNKWNENNLQTYYTDWSAQQFGEGRAKEIGFIIQKYTQYNSRKKPELLSPEIYSLRNYNEADKVVDDYNKLHLQAMKINSELSPEYKDAFYELVFHPVNACANLNELYVTVAHNWQALRENLKAANDFAEKAKRLYVNDSLISLAYNTKIANGKWNHMMDQTHIGYTYWQQPTANKMPEVHYTKNDIINENHDPLPFLISAKPLIARSSRRNLFYEENGITSIGASHYTKAANTNTITWKVIEGLGRTGSAISSFPVTAPIQTIGISSPHLEYEIYTYDSGALKLNLYFSPTLNFHNDKNGLQYGISVDDEKPQTISVNKEDNNKQVWESWVADNIIIKTSRHNISKPGKHVVKYWMVSPAVILQKIVVDFGGLKESYLGPPETMFKPEK